MNFCPTTTLAILALTAGSCRAATMTASAPAPAINGKDIANYAAPTNTDKWFFENSTAGAAKGQTFNTGSTPVLLKAVFYEVTASQKAAPTKAYAIRIGTVSGTTFTQSRSETVTQTLTWNGGEYMTGTLATPVLLPANTTCGIEVGMTSSTSAWTTGIPYLNGTPNSFTSGASYNSGTNGAGTATLSLLSSDRIFHLDMDHPMRPAPQSGASVPAGSVALSWTNQAPATGSDVWVDVWFGTSQASMMKIITKGLNTAATTVNAPGVGTYYWRVDSCLSGDSNGTPVTGDVFTFSVFDSDSDGLPDAFETVTVTLSPAQITNTRTFVRIKAAP